LSNEEEWYKCDVPYNTTPSGCCAGFGEKCAQEETEHYPRDYIEKQKHEKYCRRGFVNYFAMVIKLDGKHYGHDNYTDKTNDKTLDEPCYPVQPVVHTNNF
jgi:hypothetical protein